MKQKILLPCKRLLASAVAIVLLATVLTVAPLSASAAELIELKLSETVLGVIPPAATSYYGTPLSKITVTGVALNAETGEAVPGSWAFASTQGDLSSDTLLPETGTETAYTVVFTPAENPEAYTVLTTEIVPKILDNVPYYELDATSTPVVLGRQLTLGDLNLGKGTIYPSGSIAWVDEQGQVLDAATPVVKDQVYQWQFVADDTNDAMGLEAGWTLNGSTTPWPTHISGPVEDDYEGITYKLYVPDSYDPSVPVPLYLYLHGCGGNSTASLTGAVMDALAEKENCLVLLTEQSLVNNDARCWNWFKNTAEADGGNEADLFRLGGEPENIMNILNDVCANYAVDEDKIFVGGLSAGGYMANVMAAVYPDVFAGVMVNSGGAYYSTRDYIGAVTQMGGGVEVASGKTITQLADETYAQMGDKARIVPMVVMHGAADTLVVPQNGLDTAQCWAEIMHHVDANVSTEPVITTGSANGGTYTQYTYYNQTDGSAVVTLYMVDGLGHAYAKAATNAPDAATVSYNTFLTELPFEDVAPTDWFASSVNAVVAAGLMNGVSTTKYEFDPTGDISTAMVVTTLYRLAGTPKVAGELDCDTCAMLQEAAAANRSWYENALEWAIAEGIVDEPGEDFCPHEAITREAAITMMYRYAQKHGIDTTADADALAAFSDSAELSGEGAEAASWAVTVGLLTGNNGQLSSQNTVERSQLAVLLQRLMKLA